MLFDLRGRGRRRTVKIVYITLALLMGGGLVLFGIGGGGAMQGGLVDAITGSSGGDTGTERFDKREREAAAAHAHATRRTPPPGPRSPAPACRAPASATTSTRTRPTYTEAGKAKLDAGRRRVGEVPRARAEEARRPRGEPDGARVRPDRPQPPGGRRGGAGDHHRGPSVGDHLRDAGDLRLPGRARPARATSRATRRSSAPPRTSSNTLKSSLDQAKQQALAQQIQQDQGSATPTRHAQEGEVAGPARLGYHWAPRPCSSTGRAADS